MNFWKRSLFDRAIETGAEASAGIGPGAGASGMGRLISLLQ